MVIGVDDEAAVRLLRLFNEATGRETLAHYRLDTEFSKQLDLLGIS